MSVCVRCNNDSNSNVCSFCGMFVNNEAMKTASREESLSVISTIKKNYLYEIISLEKRTEELKKVIRNAQTDIPKYSRIRFLWPFFPLGIVAMFAVGIPYAFADGSRLGLEIVMVIALVVTILIGVGVSGSLQDKKNASIYELEASNLKKKREAEREVEQINKKIQDVKYNLKDLSDLIPLNLLTDKGLRAIEDLIASGKAANIDEAVSLVKTSKY